MSKIFHRSELAEIQRRKQGDYSDKQGTFSARVKPKILELLEEWIPKKKELEKLIEKRKRK